MRFSASHSVFAITICIVRNWLNIVPSRCTLNICMCMCVCVCESRYAYQFLSYRSVKTFNTKNVRIPIHMHAQTHRHTHHVQVIRSNFNGKIKFIRCSQTPLFAYVTHLCECFEAHTSLVNCVCQTDDITCIHVVHDMIQNHHPIIRWLLDTFNQIKWISIASN